MNNQILVIYDFNVLYEILKEIKNYFNFSLKKIEKKDFLKINFKENDNYLVISKKKINNLENQITIDKLPIEISKLIENININFLKKKYVQQSEILIGNYKLDSNSRKIFNDKKSLNLTEREINIIVFLNSSKKPVKISELQSEVWGHNLKLETHTVETHIYRLRKKILKNFNDESFIVSKKDGYQIN